MMFLAVVSAGVMIYEKLPITVTVKTEECWGFRPPPVSLTSPLCTDRQRPPCPPLPRETISERTPPTCGTAGVLVQ